MQELEVVFGIVREHCTEVGVPNKACIVALEKMVEEADHFIPLYTDLFILKKLGLIEFNKKTMEIVLTKAGSEAIKAL